MAAVVNFSLDPEVDRDILRWLDNQPNRSLAIREAVRFYMSKDDSLTLADVLAEIRSLPSRLSLVAVSTESVAASQEEPSQAAANLDGLLNRLGGDEWQ